MVGRQLAAAHEVSQREGLMRLHVHRSLRLPASEYFAEPTAKSGIALHHTVSRDLSNRYVTELKKPRFNLPSALGLLGAAAAGIVVGRAFDD